jgi:hypothetical protein
MIAYTCAVTTITHWLMTLSECVYCTYTHTLSTSRVILTAEKPNRNTPDRTIQMECTNGKSYTNTHEMFTEWVTIVRKQIPAHNTRYKMHRPWWEYTAALNLMNNIFTEPKSENGDGFGVHTKSRVSIEKTVHALTLTISAGAIIANIIGMYHL